LLSADPISGEFARIIQEGFDDNGDEDIAAIMQDISEVAEVHVEAQSDGIENDLSFSWPEGWDGGQDEAVEDTASADADEADSDELGDADVVAAPQQTTSISSKAGLDTLNIFYGLEGKTLRNVSNEASPISSATESDEPASSDADDDSDARAPPVIQAVTATIENESSGSTLEEGSLNVSKEAQITRISPTEAPDVRVLPADEPGSLVVVGDGANGESQAPLTDADATVALQHALALWRDFANANDLGERLNNISLSVAELDGNVVGITDGSHITLDPTAAGLGWFVDSTPGDDSEFALLLAAGRLAATASSDAFGRIDLHTVLVHEIGHVLGFDHDSSLEVLAGSVRPGQRVGLSEVTTQGGDAVAAAATFVGGILTITDVGPVTLTVTNTGGLPNILDVVVSIDESTTDDDVTYEDVVAIDATFGDATSGDIATLVTPGLIPTSWDLQSGDSGVLTLPGTAFDPITFSGIEVFEGGGAADEFQIAAAYTSDVVINAGAANDSLIIMDGVAVAIVFNGDSGESDTIVNPVGAIAGSLVSTGVETTIERPLLFIPGFGGTFADTSLLDSSLSGDGPLEEWLLNRGIAPDRLVLEPLMEAYSDIVATFANAGYVDGTNQAGVNGTLYSVLWDYRVPVAEPDATPDNDGILDDVSAASLIDATFDTALDYLSYYLDAAVTAWQALTGTAPDSVDVVTHSTGGLVAKSYIQSAAYTETKDGTTDHLLPVNLLIQTGVPNQGTGGPFVLLNDDFSLKSATRLLAKILKDVYTIHTDGDATTRVLNPDGSELVATSEADFVGKYIATFFDLMATYNFLDDIENASEVLTALTTSDALFNKLLTELNALAVDDFVSRGGEQLETVADKLPAELILADTNGVADGIVTFAELLLQYGGAGNTSLLEVGVDILPAAISDADVGDGAGGAADNVVTFDELVRYYDLGTYIVYSDAIDTADFAIKHTGPVASLGLKNEVLRFNDSALVGSLPGLSEVWYELKNDPGDGTVSAASSSGGFSDHRLVNVSALPGAPTEGIEHTGITYVTVSQQEIVKLLGVRATSADTPGLVPTSIISTDLLLSTPQSGVRLIELGIVDPIELVADIYSETSAKIASLKGEIDSVLDKKLPILNRSLGDLIGVSEIPDLGIDAFFTGLASDIPIPTTGTAQEKLDALEAAIELALGITDTTELEITDATDISSDGLVVLSFDINRSDSKAFNFDLSNAGPLSGTLPVTLTAGFKLQMDITVSIGDLTALAGGGLGTTGIDLAIDYAGLGSLVIDNGSINLRAQVDTEFLDPEQVRSGIPPEAGLDADQTITFSDFLTAGDTPIDLLSFDTSSSNFDFDLPISINADNALVDFDGAGNLLCFSLWRMFSPASLSRIWQ
jgi:hypothetical protein